MPVTIILAPSGLTSPVSRSTGYVPTGQKYGCPISSWFRATTSHPQREQSGAWLPHG